MRLVHSGPLAEGPRFLFFEDDVVVGPLPLEVELSRPDLERVREIPPEVQERTDEGEHEAQGRVQEPHEHADLLHASTVCPKLSDMRHEQTWDLLAEALGTIDYRREIPPTQRFLLNRDDEGNYAVLFIFTYNANTYDPEKMRLTRHEFVVPCARYNARQWTRWVIERILSIEAHETVENVFVNGERLHSPYHGNGWDPYSIWFEGDPVERAKSPGQD